MNLGEARDEKKHTWRVLQEVAQEWSELKQLRQSGNVVGRTASGISMFSEKGDASVCGGVVRQDCIWRMGCLWMIPRRELTWQGG